jgi:hypothetical protein
MIPIIVLGLAHENGYLPLLGACVIEVYKCILFQGSYFIAVGCKASGHQNGVQPYGLGALSISPF